MMQLINIYVSKLHQEWDAELANIAQTWANSCVYEHDSCRNVGKHDNLYNIFCDFKYFSI